MRYSRYMNNDGCGCSPWLWIIAFPFALPAIALYVAFGAVVLLVGFAVLVLLFIVTMIFELLEGP